MFLEVRTESAEAWHVVKTGRLTRSPHVHAIPLVNVVEPRVRTRYVQKSVIDRRHERWRSTKAPIQEVFDRDACHVTVKTTAFVEI